MARILVIDDELSDREVLRRALGMKGYEVTTVASADHALTIVFQKPFDLILSDINLIGESGISVLKKIRESQKEIPIVMYSGTLTAEIEKEARIAGANEVLGKDIGIPQLVVQLERIVKAKDRIFEDPSNRKEKSLLVVDDEENIRNVLTRFFKMKNYTIFEAENGAKALELARRETFSVVLLDINMPGMNGVATLQKLLEINPRLGVIMLTGNINLENVQKALELGAYGYVLKPFDLLYLELVVMSKLAIAEGN